MTPSLIRFRLRYHCDVFSLSHFPWPFCDHLEGSSMLPGTSGKSAVATHSGLSSSTACSCLTRGDGSKPAASANPRELRVCWHALLPHGSLFQRLRSVTRPTSATSDVLKSPPPSPQPPSLASEHMTIRFQGSLHRATRKS